MKRATGWTFHHETDHRPGMHGTIEVSSQVDEGSCFTVILPLESIKSHRQNILYPTIIREMAMLTHRKFFWENEHQGHQIPLKKD